MTDLNIVVFKKAKTLQFHSIHEKRVRSCKSKIQQYQSRMMEKCEDKLNIIFIKKEGIFGLAQLLMDYLCSIKKIFQP
jgi:hypothetical protein